jgi:uncharacterized protein YoaH (UPF0181 family)
VFDEDDVRKTASRIRKKLVARGMPAGAARRLVASGDAAELYPRSKIKLKE